jgi:MFS family permease
MSFGRAPCDEGVIRAASETPGCAARARPWVLAATILGSSMAFIDGSVVTVALPAIQADLTTSVSGAQWVANAYMLMLGALILVGGAAGDRFGRRHVFALGIAIFTAASVACGMAPNPAALIVARAVQGIGGAAAVKDVDELGKIGERARQPVDLIYNDHVDLACLDIGAISWFTFSPAKPAASLTRSQK